MKQMFFLTLLTLFLCSTCGCIEADPVEKDDAIVNGGSIDSGSGNEGDNGGNPGSGIPEDFEEEPDDPTVDMTRTFDYSILAKAGHPRLLIDAEGFKTLKTKVTSGRFTNKTLFKLHSVILDRAKKIVEMNRTFSVPEDHYMIVENILACTYAYKMTAQSAYFTKVKADLKQLCGWQNWEAAGLSKGEISLAVSLAYDWLYYEFTLEERMELHDNLVNKVLRTWLTTDFGKQVGNWHSIRAAGCGLAALAVYEKDKQIALTSLERVIAAGKATLPKIYSPDGSYLEGFGYWDYGTSFQICLLAAVEKIFGHTAGLMETPGFLESGNFGVFMHGTMNTTYSYSDGGSSTDYPLVSSWWYAARHEDRSLAFCEKYMLDAKIYEGISMDGYGPLRMRMLTPMLVLIRDFDIDAQPINPPLNEMWQGGAEMPVAMIRKGWKFDDTDVFLGIKAGHCNTEKTCNTSHTHMDIGSFVFEADGVRWSDDVMRPGYTAWFAAMREHGSQSLDTSQKGLRWDTFRVNNLGHSCIVSYTNDGSVPNKIHPNDYYVDGLGGMTRLDGGKLGAQVDMTPPMKGQVQKATRTVELVNGADLVVTDEITALEGLDCLLEWRMMSVTTAKINSYDNIELVADTNKRYLRVVSSDNTISPVYKTWKTERPVDWDPSRKSLDSEATTGRVVAGWSVTVPAGKTVKFVTTLKK